MWLEGNVQLQGVLQPVADLLNAVFGESPSRKMSFVAHLGHERSWQKKPYCHTLDLRISLDGIGAKAWDFIEFTSFGVRLQSYIPISMSLFDTPTRVTKFSIIGAASMAHPDPYVKAPVEVEYCIRKYDSGISTSTSGPTFAA
jgi:hypothetical protein